MTSTLWAKWGQWGISRRACDKRLYFSPLSSHAHNAPLPCLTHKAQGGHFRFQVMGMIEWRQKSKPKKIPGPNINPPPPQKSHEFAIGWILFAELRGNKVYQYIYINWGKQSYSHKLTLGMLCECHINLRLVTRSLPTNKAQYLWSY